MATYLRTDIPNLLTAIKQGKPCPVYLLMGDRYLCLQTAEQLAEALIPNPTRRGQSVQHIDGDQEDPIGTLNHLKTYNLFGGRQIFRVVDSKLFHSKEVAKTIWDKAVTAQSKNNTKQASVFLAQFAAIGHVAVADLAEMSDEQWQAAFGFHKGETGWVAQVGSVAEGEAKPARGGSSDPADQYLAAFEAGLPDDNILVLLAEAVDKRKRLFKWISKSGTIIDLSVAEGSSKAARTEQDTLLADLVKQTLAELGKTIEPRAVPLLLERVGFHPVAAVREAEKLALYAEDTSQVKVADVKNLVSRSREDALYELTEAVTDQDLSQALVIAGRLYETGVHPLVIVSGLRNQLRKLMLVASLRRGGSPEYVEGMAFPVFQKGYLPALKAEKGHWLDQLPSHPYALYMMFEKARRFTVGKLGAMMTELLAAELRLKSSALPPLLVIENFLWKVMPAAAVSKDMRC